MRRFRHVLMVAHYLGLSFYSLNSVAEPVERIVAVGGDVTEILYAIGAGDRIIAVDTSSRYPEDTRALPKIGYMRRLSAEPILSLAPDHIIAISDAGPKDAITVLRRAGVRYTEIPDVASIEGVVLKIHAIAAATGQIKRGNALAEEVTARVKAVLASVPKNRPKPRALFLLSVGRGSLMAGGRGSSAEAMIELAGGQNIATEFSGYKPFEPEAMLALDPDIIIVTKRTMTALGGVEQIRTQPQFATTKAAQTGRIVAFDGALLLGFGARMANAVELLTEAFYPSSKKVGERQG